MKNIFLITVLSLLLLNSKAQNSYNIVKGNNEFALEIFKMVNEKDKNIFLSPFSISTALGMVYAGARNETAKEMAGVLHFNDDIEKSNNLFKSIIDNTNKKNTKDLTINVANRLFGSKEYKFDTSYLKTCEQKFYAPLDQLNFKGDLENSRKKINTWVEEKTNDKIKELLKKGVLTPETKLVLVNAIYFYGDWLSQFDSSNTNKREFYTSETSTIKHEFMYQEHGYQYMENDKFQAIRLPYKGNQFYMEIYLPKSKTGVSDFEKEFNFENYSKWENLFTFEKVQLSLPKFKLTCDFDLSDILKKMGLVNSFSDEADFLNMSLNKDEALKIDKVIHKAFIDVSEKGTEAAAATAVVMIATTSAAYQPIKQVKIFNADHPFIFLIKDNKEGSILFMGKINQPK